MGLLLLLCAGLLLGRSWLESRDDSVPTEVVEVRGMVPNPGYHWVARPVTVAAAVAAAGGQSTDFSPVTPGSQVVVSESSAAVSPMDRRLVFGLPIALNTATRAALVSVPGIGPTRADAIVEDRTMNGPFSSTEDLARVKGIGPATVARIRPFVSVE